MHRNKEAISCDTSAINRPASTDTGSATMTGIDERQAFAKLEALKDIRHKTINLEKARVSLLVNVDTVEEEEKCLAEYRAELEQLQTEKMAHVEELRCIHQDISALENIIKQAEESRKTAQVSAKQIVLQTIHRFHNRFPQSLRKPLLGPSPG